jgi:hypothetical protein
LLSVTTDGRPLGVITTQRMLTAPPAGDKKLKLLVPDNVVRPSGLYVIVLSALPA